MSIVVLEVTVGPVKDYAEHWGRFGIRRIRVAYEQALETIRGSSSPAPLVDAIVVHCREVPEGQHSLGARSIREMLMLSDDICSLPESCAMADGRQWRAIPIVGLVGKTAYAELFRLREGVLSLRRQIWLTKMSLATYDNDGDKGSAIIRSAVEDYRLAVLAEFDDMGFIVRYEQGSYKVGPALKAREGLSGRYYFGAADTRLNSFRTVHRESFGIQVEVEQFEALINRNDVCEHELQSFFESHPHFLSIMHTPLSQIRLPCKDGSVLIPDFILKPIVAQQRDSTWEILDLKLPQEKLLAGRGSRARLSSSVVKAIRQLRDYHENLSAREHEGVIEKLLGHKLKYPNLGILIGKLSNTDVESLEREQQHQHGVKLVTYDEILERQRTQLG
jgi:hypothetical protein